MKLFDGCKIRLGAHTLRVVEVPNGDLNSDSVVGRWNSLSNTITLVEEAAPSRKVEIILHELVHACMSGWGYDGGPGGQEPLALLVGEGLTSLLAQNPQFFMSVMQILNSEEEQKNGDTRRKPKSKRRKR